MGYSNVDEGKQWHDLCASLVLGYHPLDIEYRYLCLRTRVPLLVRGGNSRTNVMLAMNEIFFKFKCLLKLMVNDVDMETLEKLFGTSTPFGFNCPRAMLNFLACNVQYMTVCDVEVPSLGELCGNVLRGVDGVKWMRFPGPEYMDFDENGVKKFCTEWYYPVLFDYHDYTAAQLNPFHNTKIDFPIVYKDLRYKRTFYLILDMHKLGSYLSVMAEEEKRKDLLKDKQAPFLAREYQIMGNMAPGECFVSWRKWTEFILERTGHFHPKTSFFPPLNCDCV